MGSKFRHQVRVEVFLKDGSRFEETVESARGSEKRFAEPSDVISKFETLAAKALPVGQVRKLRDAILGLEDLPDAAEIGRLLCRPASGSGRTDIRARDTVNDLAEASPNRTPSA